MLRVRSLLRLSSKKQANRQAKNNDEADIPAQREAIARFLTTKEEWHPEHEYVEVESAFRKGALERDVLQDALRDAKAKQYDILIVWKGDRLSRRIRDLPGIVEDLVNYGVQVWSVVDEPGGKRWNARNALDLLLLSLEGFKNQSESENISIRTKERKRQMRAHGEWTGGHVPFGYILVAKKNDRGEPVTVGGRMVRELQPHPTQAPIVRELFRRYANGAGFLSLTKWLNESAVPARNGGKWLTCTVRQILRNPLYAGFISSRTYDVVGTKGDHPSLVDEETWPRVQSIMQMKRDIPRRQQNGDYVFTGVLKCGVCGHSMGGTWWNYGDTKKPYRHQIYRCLSFRHGSYCGNRKHRVEEVETSFLSEITVWFPTRIEEYIRTRMSSQERVLEDYRVARKESTERLHIVNSTLAKLAKEYLEEGTYTREEYLPMKARYSAEKETLEAKLAEKPPVVQSIDWGTVISLVKDIRGNWQVWTNEERKQVVLSICDIFDMYIVLNKDGSITFKER